MWSLIETYGSKVIEIPFTAIIGHLCRDEEHKQVDLM